MYSIAKTKVLNKNTQISRRVLDAPTGPLLAFLQTDPNDCVPRSAIENFVEGFAGLNVLEQMKHCTRRGMSPSDIDKVSHTAPACKEYLDFLKTLAESASESISRFKAFKPSVEVRAMFDLSYFARHVKFVCKAT